MIKRSTMLRILSLWILLLSSFYAKEARVNYSVKFGIIGEVAKADAVLTTSDNRYTLEATVQVTGMIAKAVTDNLKERHISKGYIRNGKLVTDTYRMIKSYGEYNSDTTYRLDHKKKRLYRHDIKWKKGVKVLDKNRRLPYYGRSDMMTLFLNLPTLVKSYKNPSLLQFKVVGADKKNGRVDLRMTTPKALPKMRKLLGEEKKEEWFATLIMHRELYQSKQGELEIKMRNDGILQKAVLKDLVFFGDLRIELIK